MDQWRALLDQRKRRVSFCTLLTPLNRVLCFVPVEPSCTQGEANSLVCRPWTQGRASGADLTLDSGVEVGILGICGNDGGQEVLSWPCTCAWLGPCPHLFSLR